MLKTYLTALFMLSMATLTISASSLPVPDQAGTAPTEQVLEIADLK